MAEVKGYDVFLSYSRVDRDRARLIFEELGRMGWAVFMDEDIPNAKRWEAHLIDQLDRAPCVLVLWSPSARESEWVLKEAEESLKRGVLVHATLDGAPPPGQFSKFQANDLSAWVGEESDDEFVRVLRAVAMKVGSTDAVGTFPRPQGHEMITSDHLSLTSTSWRRAGEKAGGPYPYQIQLMVCGSEEALSRVTTVVYYFDPAYGQNRPDLVDPVLKAYVQTSTDWRKGFLVSELANGYSVVRAVAKVRDQSEPVRLSRLVDIMEKGPRLKELYPPWPESKE